MAANAAAEEASGISEHYVRSVFQPLWHKKKVRKSFSKRLNVWQTLASSPAPAREELTQKINQHLLRWAREADIQDETFIIDSECPRFSSGDGKGLIKASIRGDDLFFIVDVGNYSCKYKIFGHENCMSPDDHFQDLKRLIQAASGKAHRVSVVMPLCTAAASTAAITAKAWIAPWPCRSCRPWRAEHCDV